MSEGMPTLRVSILFTQIVLWSDWRHCSKEWFSSLIWTKMIQLIMLIMIDTEIKYNSDLKTR